MIFNTTCFDLYRSSSGVFYNLMTFMVFVYPTYMIVVVVVVVLCVCVCVCCLFGGCFCRFVFCL
jgi:hypothetical protein